MVLMNKWPFFQIFFLGNIGQENVFYDILEQKNTFLPLRYSRTKKRLSRLEKKEVQKIEKLTFLRKG